MRAIPEYISANQVVAHFDKILVRRERPEVTKGGIILTQQAQDYMKNNIGRVVSVGPSADKSLEEGMLVMVGKHAGDWITLPGSDEEIFICLDVDVMAIVYEE
jgi:co-chaperonin GroES (HSP10)